MTLTELSKQVHQANIKWWQDLETKQPIKRNKGELLALIHSEISEAYDGAETGLNDDKLTHRNMVEVELADVLIRALDYAAGFGYDLSNGLKAACIFDTDEHDSFIDFSEIPDFISYEYSIGLREEAVKRGIAGLHSWVSKILEHERKSRFNLVEEELANFIVFIILFSYTRGYDLQGAFQEKMAYNAKREDHKHEARKIAGGKQF